MTYAIREITPTKLAPFRLDNLTRTANGGFIVIGMEIGGATLYARNATAGNLYQSVDSGANWTLVKAFGGTATIQKLYNTADGEALVIFKTLTPLGTVYKSTGWAASHTTATFALVLTSTGGYFGAYQSNVGTCNSNGVVVINEYGAQTDSSHSSSTNSDAARRGYLSLDNGTTFSQFVDLYNMGTGIAYPAGVHVHSLFYDEDWDCVFMTFGDNTGEGVSICGGVGSGFMQVGMCFNYKDATPSWQYIKTGLEFAPTQPQITTLIATKTAIVMTGDAQWDASIFILPKTGYRTYGVLREVTTNISASFIGLPFEQRRDVWGIPSSYPIMVGFSGQSTTYPAPSYISFDDGLSFNEMYQEPDTATNPLVSGKNPQTFYGPTTDGKVICNYNLTSGALLVKADLVYPEKSSKVVSNVLSSAPVALTTNIPANVTSIVLPTGTWKLTGNLGFNLTGATLTNAKGSFNTTSATLSGDADANGTHASSLVSEPYNTVTLTDKIVMALNPTVIENIIVPTGRTTTVYLVAQATFSAGTVGAFGTLSAELM